MELRGAETLDPHETGFDGALRSLAAKILDEVVPTLDAPFGREWHRHSIFSTMQTYAAIRGFIGSARDLAACEELGRAGGRLKAIQA